MDTLFCLLLHYFVMVTYLNQSDIIYNMMMQIEIISDQTGCVSNRRGNSILTSNYLGSPEVTRSKYKICGRNIESLESIRAINSQCASSLLNTKDVRMSQNSEASCLTTFAVYHFKTSPQTNWLARI